MTDVIRFRDIAEETLSCSVNGFGLKEQFSQKNQAVQDVDEFVSSSNVALHHLLRNGCSAVNGCRQNESPNS